MIDAMHTMGCLIFFRLALELGTQWNGPIALYADPDTGCSTALLRIQG